MKKEIELANGTVIPDICIGTGIVYTYRYGSTDTKHAMKYWIKNILKNRGQLKKDRAFSGIVEEAMKTGKVMFDTSRAYGGAEYALGKELKKYDRSDYTVITKLGNTDQYNKNVRGGLEKSLKELGLDYVDIYLMHWPVTETYLDSWKEMEQLYKEGKCKAIGVCNCNIHHLEEIKKIAQIQPVINQIECHPLFTQKELREYCKNENIQVMAYTSTARADERLRKTVLVKIAQKYHKSITQVILKWHQQIGNIPVVATFNKNHLAENLNLDGFMLTSEEIEEIEKININSRLRYDPDNCDFHQL